MLKCSICGKRITNKEDVKFSWGFLTYPKVYCSNKCISAFHKIDPYFKYNIGEPMRLEAYFLLLLISTLVIFLFSVYVLITYFSINLLSIFAIFLLIFVSNIWRMYFWAKGQINKIK